MTDTDRDEVSPPLKAKIEDLFTNLPSTYPQIKFHLAAISCECRRQIAKAIEPHLNAFLATSHPRTRSDYITLTSTIDHTLTNLGLCVWYDGDPAVLTFHDSRVEGEGPSYAIMVRADNRLGYQVISLDKNAPEIEIMAAPENTVAYLRPLREVVYDVRKR